MSQMWLSTDLPVDPNMGDLLRDDWLSHRLDRWVYTGAGSRVAIIDTGTDTDHQSFNSERL